MNINGSGPPTEWYTVETYDNDLDETQVPGSPSNLIARPSSSSIRVSWGPPKDANIMVRGYTLGWGKGVPDIYTQVLEGKQRTYNIEELGNLIFLFRDGAVVTFLKTFSFARCRSELRICDISKSL